MQNLFSKIEINQDRFRSWFEELAEIGKIPNNGIHRPAFSTYHLQARKWFLTQAKTIGLETDIDAAGNHFAIYS